MICAFNYPAKIFPILIFTVCLMWANCREEHAGRVLLIFEEHNAPPRGIMEDLREEIKKIDYVKKVELLGFPETVIDIVFDEEKVQVFGVDKDKVLLQIQEQIPGRDDINTLMNIGIETKDGYLIPLGLIAEFVCRGERHDLFYKGKRVYVINIEYDKKMHTQLVPDLDAFREWSEINFIIDFNWKGYDD